MISARKMNFKKFLIRFASIISLINLTSCIPNKKDSINNNPFDSNRGVFSIDGKFQSNMRSGTMYFAPKEKDCFWFLEKYRQEFPPAKIGGYTCSDVIEVQSKLIGSYSLVFDEISKIIASFPELSEEIYSSCADYTDEDVKYKKCKKLITSLPNIFQQKPRFPDIQDDTPIKDYLGMSIDSILKELIDKDSSYKKNWVDVSAADSFIEHEKISKDNGAFQLKLAINNTKASGNDTAIYITYSNLHHAKDISFESFTKDSYGNGILELAIREKHYLSGDKTKEDKMVTEYTGNTLYLQLKIMKRALGLYYEGPVKLVDQNQNVLRTGYTKFHFLPEL